jgi:hypothetical protein
MQNGLQSCKLERRNLSVAGLRAAAGYFWMTRKSQDLFASLMTKAVGDGITITFILRLRSASTKPPMPPGPCSYLQILRCPEPKPAHPPRLFGSHKRRLTFPIYPHLQQRGAVEAVTSLHGHDFRIQSSVERMIARGVTRLCKRRNGAWFLMKNEAGGSLNSLALGAW